MPRPLPLALLLVLGAGCSAPEPTGAPELPSFEASYHPLATPTPNGEPTPDVRLQGTFLFYDDFERGLDHWTIAGDPGGVSWHRLNAYTCGGAWVMLFGKLDSSPFSAGEATIGLKAPVDLTKARRPHLTYDVMGQATPETALTLQPEARRPGGEWRPVGSVAKARYSFGFTRFADLTPYVGGPVELRFKAVAQGLAKPAPGLYLDQVQVLEPL